MKLEALISKHYDSLNPNDLIIWRYIYKHKEKCANMSIESLAEACSVSRSTVMRFAQKLGLAGYSELKVHLRWELEEIRDTPEHFVDMVCDMNIRAIQRFREQKYDRICRLLTESNRIFTYGTGMAQKAACSEFRRMMLSLNILVQDIPGEGELRKTVRLLSENDVILIVSKSGESSVLADVMTWLDSRGIPSISLTRYGNNTLAKMSTINLFVDIEEIALLENTNFESMTRMFIIMEILFTKLVEYRTGRLREEDPVPEKQ